MSLEISTTVPSNGELIMRVAGEIDADSVEQFHTVALAVLHEAKVVELDLCGVTYCDSAGLRALVLLRRAADDGNVDIALRAGAELVRLLELTGLERLFSMSPSRTSNVV